MPYFNEERKRWALEDLAYCYECARIAGIDKHLWVGFGLVLGVVREQDFIPHDDDIDMCLKRDRVTAEQEEHYVNLLARDDRFPFQVINRRVRTSSVVAPHRKRAQDGTVDLVKFCDLPNAGMFSQRKRYTRRSDDGRLTWFTLRRDQGRAKFCHWLGFDWNGYWWHSKGGMWVTHKKFDIRKWGYSQNDDAIMKGIPSELTAELIEIDFHGVKINVPARYGSCLDVWYPGWRVPRLRGASSKTVVAIVPKWKDPKTWRVLVK